MGIRGAVAVVTGASSGIGEALARELARRGVRVGLTARRHDLLNILADSIRHAGGVAAVAPADATDRDETRHAMASFREELGPIDILIANAGLGLNDSARTFNSERFEKMVKVNVVGPAYAIEAVLPSMIERRQGQIVGMSSLAAYRGLPGSAGYCATKAALSSLLEGLRPELRSLGVRVSSVHPGFVTTPMIAGATYKRPFEMTAERAARIIARGIDRGATRIDFPWPMVALLSLARTLPNWVYDRLAPRLVEPKLSAQSGTGSNHQR